MSEADRERQARAVEDQAASPNAADGPTTPSPTGDAASPRAGTPSDRDRLAAAEEADVPGSAVGTAGDELDWQAVADADPRSKGELLGALAEATRERDEFLDDLRRSHADFENYRKRVMRESASQLQAGKAAVMTSLLDVLDDLDRTLAAAQESTDTGLAKGVELVASKLVAALRNDGLERIDTDGVPFDPSEHEAVQQREAEQPDDAPVVAEVLRPGYRMGDRVLRAAMVVVEQ